MLICFRNLYLGYLVPEDCLYLVISSKMCECVCVRERNHGNGDNMS